MSLLTREHIDQLRAKLIGLPNRTPDEHEIKLEFKEISRRGVTFKLAELVIRSGSRNALSGKMICQLTDRLDEIEQWLNQADEADDQDARCLLLRGHNGTFCSGSDLVGVRQTMTAHQGWEIAQVMQHNLARLEALPLISVAFIEGYALGGGAEILLAADLRVMSESAAIGYVHARNGICCGWGGGVRLIELIGRTRALELIASGKRVKAEEARQIGLCSGKVDSLEQAIEFALDHTIESRLTCRAVKQLINSSGRLPFNEALQLECKLISSTWGKEAHQRALNINLKHK